MGLLKTALIGGVAYKLGSRNRKNEDKSCNQGCSCNHSSSNWSPPPQQPNPYYQPGYQPHGQPYGAPSQSRSAYDALPYMYANNGYQGQANYSADAYPPQQATRGMQDPYMNSAKSSHNAPPPYQHNPAYQSHNEKSPAFSPDHVYQQARYN